MQSYSAPDVVYHYTNPLAFTKILEGGELWAHDSRQTNDRRETSYALGLMTLAIGKVENTKEFQDLLAPILSAFQDPYNPHELRKFSGYLFISSFSEEPNLLSQWRAYAPENGYSIGFRSDKLMKYLHNASFQLGKVEYDFKKAVNLLAHHLKQFLNHAQTANHFDEIELINKFSSFLGSVVPLVKHQSFAEEREWRVFRYVNDQSATQFYVSHKGLTPYIPIPIYEKGLISSLKEVVVGPSDDQHTLSDWTTDYLSSLGYKVERRESEESVRIYVSGTPYRLIRK